MVDVVKTPIPHYIQHPPASEWWMYEMKPCVWDHAHEKSRILVAWEEEEDLTESQLTELSKIDRKSVFLLAEVHGPFPMIANYIIRPEGKQNN